MPKFYCNYCGQRIKADESAVGMVANCPTCAREITVPGQFSSIAPTLPVSQDASKKGGCSWVASKAILIFGCVIVLVVVKSCLFGTMPDNDVAPVRKNGASHSTSSIPLSSEYSSFHEIAGLRIKVPSKPIQEDFKLPPEAAKLMRSFQSYKVSHSGAMIYISRIVYFTSEVNLEGAADGAILQVKNLPSTTNFSSNKYPVLVSRVEGVRVYIKAQRGMHLIPQHMLIFARGSEAWQVQVVGAGLQDEALNLLSDEIFSSISLTN